MNKKLPGQTRSEQIWQVGGQQQKYGVFHKEKKTNKFSSKVLFNLSENENGHVLSVNVRAALWRY